MRTGGRGRAVPRRGRLLALLAAVPLAVAVLVTALTLLLPAPPAVTGPPPPAGEATCAQPHHAGPPPVVRSGELYACPEVFDGRRVTLVGEAVGDVLRGPDGRRWVQVNDDAYAFAGPLPTHRRLLGTNCGGAVLLPAGVAPPVLGGPRSSGDLLAVEGTYRQASAEDQGGPAVIASAVEVLQPGHPITPVRSTTLRVVTPLAVVVTAGLLAAVWRHHRT